MDRAVAMSEDESPQEADGILAHIGIAFRRQDRGIGIGVLDHGFDHLLGLQQLIPADIPIEESIASFPVSLAATRARSVSRNSRSALAVLRRDSA
ncbi:MAG: hypothetical protein EOR78_19425 [Mesorhizobium sp.]|nr:MAG: hypothetical protein EOR49_16705 [Mesorhizobium sp.]RWM43894.1 MAG: hypothetical protein EOR76_27445 [Mesorhizobium sp.]RWM53433.1 MAG: hypothetical protein EOR78_19425 [Mesorhizobium sp.]RWM56828.1 MAG: hypothetical protein EOR79_17315 [Mesorhizobium sp.]RWM96464.1 MAG: hypothetical protein EOR85_22710 [Mesorhizobium sp.]